MAETKHQPDPTAYRLYAMCADAESTERAKTYQYHMRKPGYCLVYTNEAAPERSVVVQGADLERLTPTDVKWLFESNISILAKAASDAAPKTAARMMEMLDALEIHLKAAKEEANSAEQ